MEGGVHSSPDRLNYGEDDMILDIRTDDETIHLELTGKTQTIYTPPACSEQQLLAYKELFRASVATLAAANGEDSMAQTNRALRGLQAAVDALDGMVGKC